MIGQVRRPEMQDQARMPFTMAVVHEVQRFGDIIPLNLPHMTTKDIVVQGFLIPKVGLRSSFPQLNATCHLVPQQWALPSGARPGPLATRPSFPQVPKATLGAGGDASRQAGLIHSGPTRVRPPK